MRTNQKLSSAGMVTKVSNISTKKETNHQSHRAVPTYSSCGHNSISKYKILNIKKLGSLLITTSYKMTSPKVTSALRITNSSLQSLQKGERK